MRGREEPLVQQLIVRLSILLFFITALGAEEEKSVSHYLDHQERSWIQNLDKPLKVGITQIPNQVLRVDENSYEGFFIDLFHLIEEVSGLKFTFVFYDSWQELIDAGKLKKVDIIFAAQKTPSRLLYFDFTDTIQTQQNKIIVNINNNKYNSLELLNGRKVAVTDGSAIEEFLEYNYPGIDIVPVKNELDALLLLYRQKVDAVVSEVVRASYYIKKYNLNNLKIADDLGYSYYQSIASRSDRPVLNVILSKTIAQIPQNRIGALNLKWGYVQEKVPFFDKQTIIYIAIAFGIIFPMLIYLYFINRRLQKEIVAKEVALGKVIKMRNSRLNQMSEIISMIAHQWRQPLNNLSLINQSLIVKYQRRKLNDAAIKDFSLNARRELDLLSKTIDDFSEFFKIEEEKRYFDAKETVYNLQYAVEPVLHKYGIAMHLYAGQDEKYMVKGYPNALMQVLLNLVYNARDALLEKNIRYKKIDIILEKSDEKVVLKVRDNAGGVPEEIIDKIFNPYFSTKKNKNGTGLGLYMSKIIIEEKMGGTLEVFNEKEGAVFEMIFS